MIQKSINIIVISNCLLKMNEVNFKTFNIKNYHESDSQWVTIHFNINFVVLVLPLPYLAYFAIVYLITTQSTIVP